MRKLGKMTLTMELSVSNNPQKINRNFLSALILALIFFTSCDFSSVSESSRQPVTGIPGEGSGSPHWLIPKNEIIDGGPGKDGIPSIDNPNFVSASEINFIPDNRMVVGVKEAGPARAYPHQILDWHEIVNDEIANKAFSLLYCPLTGTATGWSRQLIDEKDTRKPGAFGVSGLLFRNNLIVYDRLFDSYWSQMQLRSVKGNLGGADIKAYQVVETTWQTWKKLYPNSRVLNTDTGFERNYEGFAYGPGYRFDHDQILFPETHTDDRLRNKVRVHGIIDSLPADEDASVTVFVIDRFGKGVNLIKERVGNNDYLVAGSTDLNFATAFKLEGGNGISLHFEPVQDQLPVIMKDNEGNLWDIFGNAVEGSGKGDRLSAARSYTGYWFGWTDFFPGLKIHEGHIE